MFQNFVTVSKKRNLLFCLFLSAIASLVWTEALLYSQNSLFNNKFWFPYRALFYKGHGMESLVSRSVLAGNRLRTDNFILYQRVFSRNKIHPKEIKFGFKVKENSFMDVIYNSDGVTFEAIRLSRYIYYPSSAYKAHKDGHFIWKKPIEVSMPSSNFHSAKLQQSGSDLVLYINGKKSLQVEGRLQEGHVGFEVYEGSEIKDPSYLLTDGKKVEAGFHFSENFFKYFILNFCLVTGVLFLLAVPFRRNYLKRLRSLSLFLTGVGLLWFAFDFYYYSKMTFVWDFRKDASILQMKHNKGFDYELMRSVFFREWHLLFGGKHPNLEELTVLKVMPEPIPKGHYCFRGNCFIIEKDQKLPNFKPREKNGVRIKIIGGSLSAGTGVEEISQGYVERLYRLLDKKFAGKFEIEVLSTYSDITDEILYKDIEHFNPDFIFLDYLLKGSEDYNLEHFLKRMKGNSAEEIIMRLPAHPMRVPDPSDTANSLLSKGLAIKQKNDSEYFKSNPILAEWQNTYNFIFIDPNEILQTEKAYDEGDLWWDYFHLTAYGNSLLADYLNDHFTKLIDQKFTKQAPNQRSLKPKG